MMILLSNDCIYLCYAWGAWLIKMRVLIELRLYTHQTREQALVLSKDALVSLL